METRLLCLIEQINWFLSSISIHPIVIQIIRLVSIYLESILYMFWWNSMCPPPSGHRGRDLMVVGLTATYAISAYHHQSCEFKPHSWWGVLETTICDKVCQWLAICQWFSPGTPVSSTNKKECHNIAEILLKVALNTINQTKPKFSSLKLHDNLNCSIVEMVLFGPPISNFNFEI